MPPSLETITLGCDRNAVTSPSVIDAQNDSGSALIHDLHKEIDCGNFSIFGDLFERPEVVFRVRLGSRDQDRARTADIIDAFADRVGIVDSRLGTRTPIPEDHALYG